MQMELTRRSLMISAAALAVTSQGAFAANPKKIAEQVYGIYVDTLTKTNELLAGSPPVAEIEAEFDAMKEAAVTQLVALGQEIAEMSEGDRTAVADSVNAMVSGMYYDPETKPVYEGYQAVWAAYVKIDMDFWQKIKSLNIITQYAFFDLLRKQAPAEADRLGV